VTSQMPVRTTSGSGELAPINECLGDLSETGEGGENRMGRNMHSAGPLRPEQSADSEPGRKEAE
jgi:hypothetical protein